MKWTLAELRKQEFPFTIDELIDFTDYKSRIDGLKEMSKVKVYGQCYELDEGDYVFSLDISCDLVMQCAVSLEDVLYPLSFHVDEVFVKEASEDDVFANVIEKNTINLLEAIVDDVVLNAPMKVVKEGYENVYPDHIEKKDPTIGNLLEDFFKDI